MEANVDWQQLPEHRLRFLLLALDNICNVPYMAVLLYM